MTARARLHRALVAFTGMPDSMATPLPGFWGRSGGSRVDTLAETELSRDLGVDPDFVIAPPPPLDDSTRSRLRRRALVLIALGFATLGTLLGISDPRFTP